LAARESSSRAARHRISACALVCCLGAALPVVAAETDGAPTPEQFHRTVQKFPYIAPPERAAMIRAGLAKVKHCANKATVRSLLGEPDFGRTSRGPKGPGEQWIGSSWVYYLSKMDSGTNRNDSRAEIFFDTGDRAVWIVPTRIEGAREIGAFGERCG